MPRRRRALQNATADQGPQSAEQDPARGLFSCGRADLDALSFRVQLTCKAEQFNEGLTAEARASRGEIAGFVSTSTTRRSISALFNTGSFNAHTSPEPGCRSSQPGCGNLRVHSLILGGERIRGHINRQLDLNLALFGQGCEVKIRVVDFHASQGVMSPAVTSPAPAFAGTSLRSRILRRRTMSLNV